MPTIAQQRQTTEEQFRFHAQVNTVPVLEDDEIKILIDNSQRASLWTAATAYNYGDVIIPTVRNGHTYECIQAGTSGSTEPEWVKTDFRTQSDGSSDPVLRWQENGPDYANVFDMRTALHSAWLLKAEKVAHLTDKQQSESSYTQSQLFDHCMKMAEKYAPLLVG